MDRYYLLYPTQGRPDDLYFVPEDDFEEYFTVTDGVAELTNRQFPLDHFILNEARAHVRTFDFSPIVVVGIYPVKQ